MARYVQNARAMSDNIIVMSGLARVELETLRRVSQDFGYTVNPAHYVSEATRNVTPETVAIFFHRSAFGIDCSWLDAVREMRSAFPDIPSIICHGFSEPVDWPSLCAAGAFHAVWLPLKESEVRKSLGFVSEVRRRVKTSRVAPAAGYPAAGFTPLKPERFSPAPDSRPSPRLSGGSRPRALPSPYLH